MSRATRKANAKRAWLTGAVLVMIGACSGDVLTLGRAPDDIVVPPETGPETGVPDTSIDGDLDGGEDADADTDAEAGAPPPPPIFVDSEVVSGLSTGPRDENPTLTWNRTQIFFMSTRPLPDGGGPAENSNIWTAHWLPDAGSRGEFGEPEPVDAVNTPGAEMSPAISDNGLTLWFARRDEDLEEEDPPGLQIMVTTRASPTSNAWSEPIVVAELSDNMDDDIPRPPALNPWVMPMASRREDGVHYQNYFATFNTVTQQWGPPMLVQATYDPRYENADGFLSADGLIFYFSSNRGGSRQDIYVVTRASVNEPFAAENVVLLPGDVNTLPNDAGIDEFDERDPWVDPEGEWLFFVSDRNDMRYQIHWARLQK